MVVPWEKTVTPAVSIAGLTERNGVLWSTQCVYYDDMRRWTCADDAGCPSSVFFSAGTALCRCNR